MMLHFLDGSTSAILAPTLQLLQGLAESFWHHPLSGYPYI